MNYWQKENNKLIKNLKEKNKKMDASQKILSDLTVYMKYAKFLPDVNRRETWEELVTRNMNMHIKKFPQLKCFTQDNTFVHFLVRVLILNFSSKQSKFTKNILTCNFFIFADFAEENKKH